MALLLSRPGSENPKINPMPKGHGGDFNLDIGCPSKSKILSLAELNAAIREKLEVFNSKPFQKKDAIGYFFPSRRKTDLAAFAGLSLRVGLLENSHSTV